MAGFNENADKKIKISSKPNAVTIEAIKKEVQQMKSVLSPIKPLMLT